MAFHRLLVYYNMQYAMFDELFQYTGSSYCRYYFKWEFGYALLWMTFLFMNNSSFISFLKIFYDDELPYLSSLSLNFLMMSCIVAWFPSVVPISLYVLPFKSKVTIKLHNFCSVAPFYWPVCDTLQYTCIDRDWGTYHSYRIFYKRIGCK